MNMLELSQAGGAARRLPGLVGLARRVLFRLMYPYFAAILGELTAVRQHVEATGHIDASDVRAIRNRLADIEDRLTSTLSG